MRQGQSSGWTPPPGGRTQKLVLFTGFSWNSRCHLCGEHSVFEDIYARARVV